MLHKRKASTLLTGSRGLDRAQVITVDTKINTFRFSKWLISSFRAVGPKKRSGYLDPFRTCFKIMCTFNYQRDLK